MATVHLEVVTIEGKLFDDHVNMVIAPGSEGVLGILPHHEPLLTALKYGELKIKKEGEADQFFAISGGFMETQPDHIVVLADAAEHAEEIDIERAKQAKQRAEELLDRAKKGDMDFAQAESALQRSILRLKVAQHRPRRKDRPGVLSIDSREN